MARGQRWDPRHLKRLREGTGLSPEDFAARTGGGITGRSIRRWEASETKPDVEALEQLADAYNIDIGMFFEPADPNNPHRRKAGRPKKTP